MANLPDWALDTTSMPLQPGDYQLLAGLTTPSIHAGGVAGSLCQGAS